MILQKLFSSWITPIFHRWELQLLDQRPSTINHRAPNRQQFNQFVPILMHTKLSFTLLLPSMQRTIADSVNRRVNFLILLLTWPAASNERTRTSTAASWLNFPTNFSIKFTSLSLRDPISSLVLWNCVTQCGRLVHSPNMRCERARVRCGWKSFSLSSLSLSLSTRVSSVEIFKVFQSCYNGKRFRSRFRLCAREEKDTEWAGKSKVLSEQR